MKIARITLDTGFPSCQHEDEVELPEDWDEMPEVEQEEFLYSYGEELIRNYIEISWEIEEE